MHDFIGGALEYFFQPAVDDLLVEVTAAEVPDRDIAGPALDSDSVAHHFAIPCWPPGPAVLQIRVAGLHVDGNLRGTRNVGQFQRRHPLIFTGEQGHL